jgi:hypothetical protein
MAGRERLWVGHIEGGSQAMLLERFYQRVGDDHRAASSVYQ